MCCPIGSEMWVCVRYKQRKRNKNHLLKLYISNCNAMQLKLLFIFFFFFLSSGFHIDTRVFLSLLRVVYGTCSTRNCLLYHGCNAVTDESWRKCRLLDHGYNSVAMTLGPAAMLCPGFCTGSWQKRSKSVKYCVSIHTLWPPPDEREDMCKFRLRSVQKCGFVSDTNKQTNKQKRTKSHFIFIYEKQNRVRSFQSNGT
jgi:hypothetical protein